MDFIEKINEAGQAYMLAESEVSMGRMLGGMGRKMDGRRAAMKKSKEALLQAYAECGYKLAELRNMVNANGESVFLYGVLDLLDRFVPYED